MFPYQGRTALVTGASSGIGVEFARALAPRGMRIVLTARSESALHTLAAELSQQHGAETLVVPADLSREESVKQIVAAAQQRGWAIDLLVNNAGLLTHGCFESIDPARERDEIMVNVASMVALTHSFLPGMLERRQGGVINVASIAGFQPIPYMAVYSASKAFVISFSVALWEECRDRNVCVLALCPGTTATNLFKTALAPEAELGRPRQASQVVATALASLDKRRSLVVDGLKNSLLSHGPRLIPRWFAAKCAGAAVRPKAPGAKEH
jgi:short-subunit dehydrogenase